MKSRAKGRQARTFPTQPLREAIRQLAFREVWDKNDSRVRGMMFGAHDKNGVTVFCEERGILQRNLYQHHLTDWTVDAICIRAGIHPSEVYDDWFTMSERLTQECA